MPADEEGGQGWRMKTADEDVNGLAAANDGDDDGACPIAWDGV